MRWVSLATVARVTCALAALSSLAGAQSSTVAAELYDKGLSEMNAERYDSACPTLAESVRLDRRPGALFTLAECEARRGRAATALGHFEDYLSWYARAAASDQALQQERHDLALARKAELAPKVARVTLTLPESARGDISVELDGTKLERAALGVALPLDPGPHLIVVRAGSETRRQNVDVSAGQAITVTLELPVPAGESAAPIASDMSATRDTQPIAPPRRDDTRRAWTYGAFAVGATGVVVGSLLGALAWREKSKVDDGCNADRVCSADGKDAADRLQRYALFSNIAFGIGAAGVVAGVILWSTEKPTGSASPRLRLRALVDARGRTAAQLEGRW